MRTAAVVVDWRKPNETLAALRSLSRMVPPPDTIVCVENESAAEQVRLLNAQAPSTVKFIECAQNIGFAAAVNLGMKAALEDGAEWVLVLNNDALVMTNCLQRCIEYAISEGNAAAVGPAIAFMDSPERLWFGGGYVNSWLAFTRHRGLMQPSSSPPPSGDTDFVTGCCMLISVAAWNQLGPFRADFFAYYEDAEWCQRARAGGWRCLYVGEVLCVHAVSVSSEQRGSLGLSPNTAYYLGRNPVKFAIETKDAGRRLTRLLGLMIIWNAYNFWRLIQARNSATAAAYVRGVVDAFRGRMGAAQFGQA